MIYEPFQRATLPSNFTYDLIFTSPPFYNFEIYTNDANQSAIEYDNFADWLVYFLFFSIYKSWLLLDIDGYFVIYISDTKQVAFCEVTNLFMQCMPNAMYCGVISSVNKGNVHRPTWIWKKKALVDDKRREMAINFLKTNHMDIYNKAKKEFVFL